MTMRKLILTCSLFALTACAEKLVGPEAQAAARTYQTKTVQAAPLVIVNGVETDTAALRKLNADQVESVEVIKGASAQKLYGDRAVNGVILVSLKKK